MNLQLERQPGKSNERLNAEATHGPYVGNALTAINFATGIAGGQVDINESVAVLKASAAAIHTGDMREPEALLMSQAIALNAIFAETTRRSALNMGQHPGAAADYMRMAMRAQSQCRATIETLGALKNPPAVFAKQANIATNQQINHAPVEKQISPNEKTVD